LNPGEVLGKDCPSLQFKSPGILAAGEVNSFPAQPEGFPMFF